MYIKFVNEEEKKQHKFGDLVAGEVFIDPEHNCMWIKTDNSMSAVCLNNGELSDWEDNEQIIPVKSVTLNYKL